MKPSCDRTTFEVFMCVVGVGGVGCTPTCVTRARGVRRSSPGESCTARYYHLSCPTSRDGSSPHRCSSRPVGGNGPPYHATRSSRATIRAMHASHNKRCKSQCLPRRVHERGGDTFNLSMPPGPRALPPETDKYFFPPRKIVQSKRPFDSSNLQWEGRVASPSRRRTGAPWTTEGSGLARPREATALL